MDRRCECPNPKCSHWNRLETRYCARCGTALDALQTRVASPVQLAPHWCFTLIFVCFVLVVLAGLVYAVGPVMLVILPVVGGALLWGSGAKAPWKRARYNH